MKITGIFTVRFVNDAEECVHIQQIVYDTVGVPIFLISNSGVIYNWHNIISMQGE